MHTISESTTTIFQAAAFFEFGSTLFTCNGRFETGWRTNKRKCRIWEKAKQSKQKLSADEVWKSIKIRVSLATESDPGSYYWKEILKRKVCAASSSSIFLSFIESDFYNRQESNKVSWFVTETPSDLTSLVRVRKPFIKVRLLCLLLYYIAFYTDSFSSLHIVS